VDNSNSDACVVRCHLNYAPATAINFTSWIPFSFFLGYVVYKYKQWWKHCNYVLFGGLDAGTAFIKNLTFSCFKHFIIYKFTILEVKNMLWKRNFEIVLFEDFLLWNKIGLRNNPFPEFIYTLDYSFWNFFFSNGLSILKVILETDFWKSPHLITTLFDLIPVVLLHSLYLCYSRFFT